MTPLSRVSVGQQATLLQQNNPGLMGQRLTDLGFTPRTLLRVVRIGPRDSLVAVDIRSTVIALRKTEAEQVLVEQEHG